jgi:hypothetical protein
MTVNLIVGAIFFGYCELRLACCFIPVYVISVVMMTILEHSDTEKAKSQLDANLHYLVDASYFQ